MRARSTSASSSCTVVPGGELDAEGVRLHLAEQLPRRRVDLRLQPHRDVEVGRPGHVAVAQQRALPRGEGAQLGGGLHPVGRGAQQDEGVHPVRGRRTRPGAPRHPPPEEPTTAQRSMPRWSRSATMSSGMRERGRCQGRAAVPAQVRRHDREVAAERVGLGLPLPRVRGGRVQEQHRWARALDDVGQDHGSSRTSRAPHRTQVSARGPVRDEQPPVVADPPPPQVGDPSRR
jgi:hypothetical protein